MPKEEPRPNRLSTLLLLLFLPSVEQGFLISTTVGMGGESFSVLGVVLCTTGSLAASLAFFPTGASEYFHQDHQMTNVPWVGLGIGTYKTILVKKRTALDYSYRVLKMFM